MSRHRCDQSGSVLMLVPAGILVLLILAAIAIDGALVLMAQRDLANRAAAVSNDLAVAALSDGALYRDGGILLDEHRAEAYVRLAFDPAHRPDEYESWSGRASADGRRVEVVATAEVKYLFAPAIPGLPRSTTVVARSIATMHSR